MLSFFFESYGDHRDLHSFPTRRSSDLSGSRSASQVRVGMPASFDAFRAAPMAAALEGDTAMPSMPCVMRSDRKSTRLNSSHANISYAVFCLKKNKNVSSRYLRAL